MEPLGTALRGELHKDELQVGQLLCVRINRWDAPAGTLARVDTVGSTADLWCFTVVWLTRAFPVRRSSRRSSSLNLFEEDLASFEVFEGPVPSPPLYVRPRRASATRRERPLQLALPFDCC